MAKKKRKSIEERTTFIMQLFREMSDRELQFRYLVSASGRSDREGKNMTRRILDELIEASYIEPTTSKTNSYRLSRRNMPHHKGTVTVMPSGAMFVKVEDLAQDIFIPVSNQNCALAGDVVELVIVRHRRNGMPEGAICSIIERSSRQYAATVRSVTKVAAIVEPDSRHLPESIYLPLLPKTKVEIDDRVTFRITDWEDAGRMPNGEFIGNLGKKGENDAEIHAIMVEFDLPVAFSEEVEAAANRIDSKISDREYAERRDMREVTTFTIDPADAKDFDDALSLQRIDEQRWEIGVHIADVSHYVTPGSILDKEAYERGTSVYLVDRTIPMLPERLSNELCSLRPDEDKLCFSAVFVIKEDLTIESEWFGRTIIRSDKRFTYEEAQEIIEGKPHGLSDAILTLNRLAQAMRKARMDNGAIAFDRPEAKFHLDENGRPTGVYYKVMREANQLIEEFMLLANRRVATYCAKRNGRPRTMVFRVHDEPNVDKFERFRTFIRRFGHHFKSSKGKAVAHELNALLADVRKRPENNVVTMLAMRAMAKAAYSTDNVGHYGLAFPYYTHFTSPIRRYPDVMVHRILQHYLDGGRSVDKTVYEEQCEYSSEREVVAAEAERASIKYKMVEFMADKIGEEFEGHVSGLSDWGVFVELNDSIVEGMVPLSDIRNDFYRFDAERYEIYGERAGHVITLGDDVVVRVRSIDLRRRLLTFSLVEVEGENFEEYYVEPQRRGQDKKHRR